MGLVKNKRSIVKGLSELVANFFLYTGWGT